MVLVAPRMGAWIEIISKEDAIISKESLPAWRACIEINISIGSISAILYRSPYEEYELKLFFIYPFCRQDLQYHELRLSMWT